MSFCEIKKNVENRVFTKTVSKPGAQICYNRREKSGRDEHRKSGNARKELSLIRIMLDTEKKIGIRIEIKKGFKGLLEAIFFFSLQFFVIIQNLTISFVTGWFAGGLLFTCC